MFESFICKIESIIKSKQKEVFIKFLANKNKLNIKGNEAAIQRIFLFLD